MAIESQIIEVEVVPAFPNSPTADNASGTKSNATAVAANDPSTSPSKKRSSPVPQQEEEPSSKSPKTTIFVAEEADIHHPLENDTEILVNAGPGISNNGNAANDKDPEQESLKESKQQEKDSPQEDDPPQQESFSSEVLGGAEAASAVMDRPSTKEEEEIVKVTPLEEANSTEETLTEDINENSNESSL